MIPMKFVGHFYDLTYSVIFTLQTTLTDDDWCYTNDWSPNVDGFGRLKRSRARSDRNNVKRDIISVNTVYTVIIQVKSSGVFFLERYLRTMKFQYNNHFTSYCFKKQIKFHSYTYMYYYNNFSLLFQKILYFWQNWWNFKNTLSSTRKYD